VYRFVSTRFPDGLSCEGARRHGGRWNSKGVAVLYCAASESLVMLELRVHSPHPYPCTRFGDAWAAASSSLGLLVPSVVASEEKNLILNPSHPRFQEVRLLSKRRVVLDKRLYSVPEKRRSSAQKKKK
jgi:RES domain-containing protein